MNKKLLSFLLISTLTIGVYQLSAFLDVGKGLKKVTESIGEAVEDVAEVAEKQIEKVTDVVKDTVEEEKGFFSRIFSFDKIALANLPIIYIILIAFAIGIAASFTPCIYPMIPITLGILQSQASPSVGRNFLLATSYVFGIATVYATLGYFAATTTLILGQWLANPWFISVLILLFLYLAFSMFGFYEIYVPKVMRGGKTVKVKGSLLYSFAFGAISGTAASPCLTPPLALLLGFVAKRGNPLVGFFTLFAFALGLGLLLIVVGTFSNTITNLPRAGAWMNEIKKFFGFLLLGVSIYFLNPFVSDITSNIFYGALLAGMAVYYGLLVAKAFKKA